VTEQAGKFAIALLRVRAGELASHDCFFPKVALGESLEDVLAGFLRHYNLQPEHRQFIAAKVLMAQRLLDRELLEAAIYQQVGRRIRLVSRASDREKHWLRMANRNAEQALLQRSVKDRQYYGQWQDLKDVLSLTDEFNLIECFDISHTQGESTKAACVVFDSEGASKRRYRQYNVDPHEVAAGDDYAAMRFAVRQRYSKALLEGRALPNLLLIDGGLGQLNAVKAVLDELQIDDVLLLGMAKGRSRKVGMERLLRVDGSLVQLPPHRPAFHLLAHVRDEAHRSGIRAHRRTRDRARTQSGLEVIKGVGPKKREALLRHFGGLQGLKKASVAEIMKVPGITATLAERVKSHLSSL
jgi:excinuclease ABC subunit C